MSGKKHFRKGPVRLKVDYLIRHRIRLTSFRARHRHHGCDLERGQKFMVIDNGDGTAWIRCNVCGLAQVTVKDL